MQMEERWDFKVCHINCPSTIKQAQSYDITIQPLPSPNLQTLRYELKGGNFLTKCAGQ